MATRKVEDVARIGFEAYSERVNWKTFDGRQIPKWENLTDSVRMGWIAAASAIIKAYDEDINNLDGT